MLYPLSYEPQSGTEASKPSGRLGALAVSLGSRA